MPIDRRISELFDNLDLWRHLPGYRLDRRIEVFFSLFLPLLLENKYHRRCSRIIPEFPVQIPTTHQRKARNLTFKVDYLAVLEDLPNENSRSLIDKPKSLIFVKLKTETASRRNKEDRYFALAQGMGMAPLLRGVARICSASSTREEYRTLTFLLKHGGLIEPDAHGRFKPAPNLPRPEVLYIQPKNAKLDARVMTFQEVYDQLTDLGDALSERFAESLRGWASVKVGDSGG
jgi:hypothetical protein